MYSRGRLLRVLFLLAAAMMAANGLWMLADAHGWFRTIPAGLADTGPVNGHFVRDVGLVYLLFGAALAWCMQEVATRRPVFVLIAMFMVGHALDHVAEILLGALPPRHWLLDLPLVLGPGILFGVFLHPGAWMHLAAD